MTGLDHELLIAKFRLKLKKEEKTTRPFTYDLNQIPYDYSEVEFAKEKRILKHVYKVFTRMINSKSINNQSIERAQMSINKKIH